MQALLHVAALSLNMWGDVLRHLTWLKNCTSTCAPGGKIPWQALYGTLLDLSCLKCFGEAVWVHDPTGLKLDPCTWEGCWISFNTESHGHCVYWPANKSVSVERSVYFTVAEQLEGRVWMYLPSRLHRVSCLPPQKTRYLHYRHPMHPPMKLHHLLRPC